MKRRDHCFACVAIKNGVKSRRALKHTCSLGDNEPQYIYKLPGGGFGILKHPVKKENLPR